MASFLSILKGVGRFLLAAEHPAALVAESLLPGFAVPIAAFDKFVQDTHSAIAAAEMKSPQGGGPDKFALAVSAFEDSLQVAQEALAVDGKTLTYDQAKLKEAIDASVASFQKFADLKATMKVVDAVKT